MFSNIFNLTNCRHGSPFTTADTMQQVIYCFSLSEIEWKLCLFHLHTHFILSVRGVHKNPICLSKEFSFTKNKEKKRKESKRTEIAWHAFATHILSFHIIFVSFCGILCVDELNAISVEISICCRIFGIA